MKGYWDLGLVVCLIWTGSDVFLSTTSIMHLCAIAIYRYCGISNPLQIRSSQTKRHVLALLIPAWTVSAAITVPLIVQGVIARTPVLVGNVVEGFSCGIFDQTFAIYSSLVSFFIPLTIMIVADMRSVQILRKSVGSKRRTSYRARVGTSDSKVRFTSQSDDSSGVRVSNGLELNSTSPELPYRIRTCSTIYEESPVRSEDQPGVDITFSTQTTPVSELTTVSELEGPSRLAAIPAVADETASNTGSNKPPQTATDNPRPLSLKTHWTIRKVNSREKRAKRTLIWVFICFVALWLPFFVTNFTYGVCRSCEIPDDLFAAFTWLGYISSGVNPCLYTYLNKDFRFAFKKILMCGQYGGDRLPVALPSTDKSYALGRGCGPLAQERQNRHSSSPGESERRYSAIDED